MQSEAVSESSPAAGPDKSAESAESDRSKTSTARKGTRAERRVDRKTAKLEVTFDSQRMRHLAWAAFHLTFGALLIIALGTVAKAIGAFFLFLGALRAIKFALRAGGPEATITVDGEATFLPMKLTTRDGDRGRYEAGEIASVFYLRRSMPWFRISPILVIESAGSGGKPGDVYRFPRDWFASDADQRRVADTLSARIGRQLPATLVTPLEPEERAEGSGAAARRNRAVGFFIASGVLVMIGNLGLADFLATMSIPTTAVYVASGLCFIAGAYFLLFVPEAERGSDRSDGKPRSGGS